MTSDRPKYDSQPFESKKMEEIAAAIEIKLDDWRGHCHYVVLKMKKLGLVSADAEIRRMSPGPWPAPAEPDKPLVFHDYFVLEDGTVVDPTRWCFDEPSRPNIYVGRGDGVVYDGEPLPAYVPPTLDSILHAHGE